MNKEIQEYFRIYKPESPTNSCCFMCQKCAGDCDWSNDGTPIEGWKIRNTPARTTGGSEPGVKILWCPEFVEGDPLEVHQPDEDSIMRLFESLVRSSAEDYKAAAKRKLQAERILETSTDPIARGGAEMVVESSNATMKSCEHLLGDHCRTLRARARKELLEEQE